MSVSVATAAELLDFGARLRRSASDPQPPQALEQLRGAVAVHNILRSERVAYLADEVGMGKTYVALGAIALFRHFNPQFRVAVIAPRENIQQKWMKEWHSFTTHLVRIPDLRVRALGEGPARGVVACENLRHFVREASLDCERDFFLRMSSFSLGVGEDASSWRDMRQRFGKELPWLSDELLTLASKRRFKDNLAKAICSAIPEFDLLVVDEAHALKHGFSEHIAARNRVLAFVFGTAPEEIDKREFPYYGLRAKRVLLLSATPIEDDYRQLWNQLYVVGKSAKFKALADPHVSEDEKKLLAQRFLLRRVTVLSTVEGQLTKNLYRREWRRGGLSAHDQPIEVSDVRRRLAVALIQKKVAELLNSPRFNSTFQMGMLASFESFLETALPSDADAAGNFDDAEQTEDRVEREGVDVRMLNQLAGDYRRKFKQELPHPKMDALVDRIASSWETGRKALVFMRRVASVWEVKERLDAAYDAWLFRRLENHFKPNLPLFEELQSLRDEYQSTRGDRRGLIARRAGVAKRQAADDEDRGGLDTFFAWYFRGDGPNDWLSGGAFSKRFIQPRYALSTLFEDNHVAAVLEVSPADARTALARALGHDLAVSDASVSERAAWFFSKAKRHGRGELFEAAQAAALELLSTHAADPEVRHRAQEIFHRRFHFRKQSAPRPQSQAVERYLEIGTFFSALRDSHWQPLRSQIWPASERHEFGEQFHEQELRRELLSAALRLGNPVVDFYAGEMLVRGTMKAGRQDEETTESFDDGPIERLLRLLDEQRMTPREHRGWAAFDELADIAAQFELIVDVNEPQVRLLPLHETGRLFGALLRAQQPVAGMSGEVTKTVVRQFRMPGYPLVLLSTDLLQEGEDLHTFCADVYHYGLAWTPSAIEQRIGRVDRVRSLTERVLQGHNGTIDGERRLQVYYPHLEDTVERLQVRRVLRRMNEFIRLMHEGLAAPAADQSRLNIAREILELTDVPPVLDRVLETAFPVRAEQLAGERLRLAVSREEANGWVDRFHALTDRELPDVRITWDAVKERGVALGVATLPTGRTQPFGLYLKSYGGELVVRCVSVVGSFDLEADWAEAAEQLKGSRARLYVAKDEDAGTVWVTVEEDVLLGDQEHDRARVAWLIARVASEADQLEREVVEGKDADLNVVRPVLITASRTVSDGAAER